MTLSFTPLERAALERICIKHPDVCEALQAQLATATVIRRENSGAGLFTYLAVDRSTQPIAGAKPVLGNVTALIEGFKQQMVLLLFTKEGYADMLEGATIEDSTSGLDFASLQFTIEPG
jgi:hypothetical protein